MSTFHASKIKALLTTALEKQISILQGFQDESGEIDEGQSSGETAALIRDLKDELKGVSPFELSQFLI